MFTPTSAPRSQPQPGHLYDVAVIGAGLAGTELSWRLARGGQDVLLVSQALDHLGNLYQPTVDGVSFPAQSLFEQVRRATAPETDGWVFHRRLKAELEGTAGIHLLQSCVTGISEPEPGAPDAGQGVQLSTWEGPPLRAKAVVLAVGAFLKGRLLIGETMEEAGRLSEVAYDFLAENLAAQGVYLTYAAAQVQPTNDAPEYEVRFQVLDASELLGSALRRFDRVYALGRCTPGDHTYTSVLQDAATLAAQLGAPAEDQP